MRGTDIARALGYKNTSKVSAIWRQYKDEFDGGMCLNLESGVRSGSTVPSFYFNRRGAWLIAMFANTELAKTFRKWVLDVLEERVEKQLPLPNPAKDLKLAVDGINHARQWVSQIRALVPVSHMSGKELHLRDHKMVLLDTAFTHLDYTLFQSLPKDEQDAANRKAMMMDVAREVVREIAAGN